MVLTSKQVLDSYPASPIKPEDVLTDYLVDNYRVVWEQAIDEELLKHDYSQELRSHAPIHIRLYYINYYYYGFNDWMDDRFDELLEGYGGPKYITPDYSDPPYFKKFMEYMGVLNTGDYKELVNNIDREKLVERLKPSVQELVDGYAANGINLVLTTDIDLDSLI